MMTRTDWVFNPSVMMANALTAFVLNLVRAWWQQAWSPMLGHTTACLMLPA